MLPEAGGRLSQGEKIGKICRGLGISEESYYRWRWTESRPGNVWRSLSGRTSGWRRRCRTWRGTSWRKRLPYASLRSAYGLPKAAGLQPSNWYLFRGQSTGASTRSAPQGSLYLQSDGGSPEW